jgi:predicted adenylyl cyclase CyaB
MPLNVEIKARCEDPRPIRDHLLMNHARFEGTDHQRDTYFQVANGRMKLRQGNIENALIHYDRPDRKGPKSSQVTLFPVQNSNLLRSLLEKASGIHMVVEKEREIYFIGHVKFHIDIVKGLGNFIEIEAIDSDGSIGQDQLERDCRRYMEAFGIQEKDLIHHSYADMMEEAHITSKGSSL